MFEINQPEFDSVEEIKPKSNRGGRRSGSGRKKDGGHVGRLRKVTTAKTVKALENSTTPLEYMLKVLNDPGTDQKRRDAMAIAAAPYLHARLAATEHSGKIETTHEERLAALSE
jgi:hypothetical protein